MTEPRGDEPAIDQAANQIESPDSAEVSDRTELPDRTGAADHTGASRPAGSADEPDAPEPAVEDLEGPRRRARREREARREAQARATAIEQARREAKRRAMGLSAQQSGGPGRGAVRGLKVMAWSVAIAVLVVGLGLVLYFTPIMSARTIEVTGLGALTQDEVVAAAAVAPGTPLLQVDTDAVAGRVASIRRVASARVQRQYPSTLRITVVERVPVVVKDYPDGVHYFDEDGVDFATGPPPPGVPYLETENPGPNDPATKAALTVMTSLRPEVAGQVGRVSAPSVASITLTLVDGRTVVWGTTDRTEEKALKLAALLTQPGQTYDVSSPDLPTVK